MMLYDLVGIGVGPFNLSLACLSEPLDNLHTAFFDRQENFNWHPGMMLDDAQLQTPFMSDLVTLADPTHPLSFLNYAKQQGRLYSFYIRENFFLLRKEYNQYCQWASQQLSNVHFGHTVETIERDGALYRLTISHRGQKHQVHARHLVLGTGPVPAIPPCCEKPYDAGIHSSDYLHHKHTLQQERSLTVVGSGQSAAEIFKDLLQEMDDHHYELNWITRSARFSPLEYTKLTLEMTSPEYVDYFHSLPPSTRRRLLNEQRYLYKGINSELVNEIFDLLYAKNLDGKVRCNILTNSNLQSVERNGSELKLGLFQSEQQAHFHLNTSKLILATGYRYQLPACLAPLKDSIRWDEDGRFAVRRNYSIQRDGAGGIFVQNAELHTHGFVTPDLGMACYRNSCILREVLGYEAYPVEQKIAFQQFSAKPLPAFSASETTDSQQVAR